MYVREIKEKLKNLLFENIIIIQFSNFIILPCKVVFWGFSLCVVRSHRDCDDDIGFLCELAHKIKGYIIITKGDSLNHTKRVFEVFAIIP